MRIARISYATIRTTLARFVRTEGPPEVAKALVEGYRVSLDQSGQLLRGSRKLIEDALRQIGLAEDRGQTSQQAA